MIFFQKVFLFEDDFLFTGSWIDYRNKNAIQFGSMKHKKNAPMKIFENEYF